MDSCNVTPTGKSIIRLSNSSFRDFREKLCEVHSNWALDEPMGGRFDAEICSRNMGDIGFTDVKVGFGLSGKRGRADIKHTQDSFYGVILMISGGQRLVQGNQVVELQSGDISVWDASRPAEFSSSGPVRQVSVLIPHRKLKLYSANIEDVCAQKIAGHSGLGLLLASHLQALRNVLPNADEITRSGAAQATLDLVSAAIRPSEAAEFKSSIHRTMHRRVQEYILDNLRDPGLSPQIIADAFRISSRYLHKVFEGTGFSVSEWVLNMRLAACRSALEDPALNHMTITEIAFNWGFNSAAYFSRSYRQQFDMSPSDTRNRLRH